MSDKVAEYAKRYGDLTLKLLQEVEPITALFLLTTAFHAAVNQCAVKIDEIERLYGMGEDG